MTSLTAELANSSELSPFLIDDVWSAIFAGPHTITNGECIIRETGKGKNAANELRARLEAVVGVPAWAPITNKSPALNDADCFGNVWCSIDGRIYQRAFDSFNSREFPKI